MEAPMTAADVAAVMGNRNNGSDWAGGSGMWIFALIILFGFMRGGWGGNDGNAVTEAALCSANSFNELKSQVGRGFDQQSQYAFQNQRDMCTSTATLSGQMTNGFAAIQNTAMQGNFDLSRQLSDCCCSTKQLILETQYKAEQNKCEILAAVREGDWNAERRAMQGKIDSLENANLRGYIAEQFCGVPRFPQQVTYSLPLPAGYGNGCCNQGTYF